MKALENLLLHTVSCSYTQQILCVTQVILNGWEQWVAKGKWSSWTTVTNCPATVCVHIISFFRSFTQKGIFFSGFSQTVPVGKQYLKISLETNASESTFNCIGYLYSIRALQGSQSWGASFNLLMSRCWVDFYLSKPIKAVKCTHCHQSGPKALYVKQQSAAGTLATLGWHFQTNYLCMRGKFYQWVWLKRMSWIFVSMTVHAEARSHTRTHVFVLLEGFHISTFRNV